MIEILSNLYFITITSFFTKSIFNACSGKNIWGLKIMNPSISIYLIDAEILTLVNIVEYIVIIYSNIKPYKHLFISQPLIF